MSSHLIIIQQQSACVSAKVFARYDVVETSYHFYSDRIDLHLCDDPGGSKCQHYLCIYLRSLKNIIILAQKCLRVFYLAAQKLFKLSV